MERYEIICLLFKLVLLIAAWFMVRDILRIVRQLRAFRDITIGIGIASGDTRSPEEIAGDVKPKLDNIGKNREDHYVIRRLRFAIEMVLGDDSGQMQLPSVDEWYIREMEEENTRVSVSIARTLVASLLIMGIVGTLICLHGDSLEKIAAGKIDALHVALQPSLWAIGGTIVLLALRGFYRSVFERLESLISRYTLEVILPCFQLSTSTEQMEEDMTQSVDILNGCIRRIANNFRQNVYPFVYEVCRYRQSMGSILNSLGTNCESIPETAGGMDENMEKGKRNMQQIHDIYQQVLPILREMDTLLVAIPNKLQNLLSLMQKHLGKFTALSSELSSVPQNTVGQLAPELKKVFDNLRERYRRAQTRIYTLRTHDQQSLLDSIQNEVKALENTEASLNNSMSPMNDAIQDIRNLIACLQNMKNAYTETTLAQAKCMEECKKKLDSLRTELSERGKRVNYICAALRRRYLAYRKRPWLFLNRWDLLASSLLLGLLVLKLYL